MSVAVWTFLAIFTSLFWINVAAQEFSISKYTVIGTGCAPSTVSSAITPSGENVFLSYSDFTAYAGPQYTYADSRKNCQLTMSVQVPKGYQFAFDKFDHNASYSIGSGVIGSFATKYYFQATLNTAQGNGSISGPAKLDSCTLGSSFRPVIWSPCGQNSVVNVDTSIHLSSGDSSSGTLTIHSTPSNNFVWRTC